jgi:hypothetical protein
MSLTSSCLHFRVFRVFRGLKTSSSMENCELKLAVVAPASRNSVNLAFEAIPVFRKRHKSVFFKTPKPFPGNDLRRSQEGGRELGTQIAIAVTRCWKA